MLRCRVCHTSVIGEETYCPHCGSPLQIPGGIIENAPTAVHSLPKKQKKWPLLAAAAAVIGAAGIALALFRPWTPSNYLCMESHFDTLGTTLYLDGEPLERFDTEVGMYFTSTLGQVFFSYENETIYMEDGQRYALPEGWTTPVFSSSGFGMAAVAEDGLHHYDLVTGTDTLVDSDYTIAWIQMTDTIPCISPDGSALSYVGEDDALYLWRAGEETRQVARGSPAALSDGGELLYYYDEIGRFYVTDGSSGVLLAGKGLGSTTFNADKTQVLFCSGDKLFLSRNGGGAAAVPVGEPVEQSYPIYPAGTGYGVRSFLGETVLLQTKYNDLLLGRVDGPGKFTLLAEDVVGRPQRSSDGSTLVWIAEAGLYRLIQGPFARPELVLSREDFTEMDFVLSSDGKHCFFYGQGERMLLDLSSGVVTPVAEDGNGWIINRDSSALWLVNSSGERMIVEHLAWDGAQTAVLDIPYEGSVAINHFRDGVVVTIHDTAYYLPPDGGPGTALSQP